jgi:hypothetical protein
MTKSELIEIISAKRSTTKDIGGSQAMLDVSDAPPEANASRFAVFTAASRAWAVRQGRNRRPAKLSRSRANMFRISPGKDLRARQCGTVSPDPQSAQWRQLARARP